jgi:hypothetical protein
LTLSRATLIVSGARLAADGQRCAPPTGDELMLRRTSTLLACIALLPALLVACGGDDDDGDASPTGTSATSRTAPAGSATAGDGATPDGDETSTPADSETPAGNGGPTFDITQARALLDEVLLTPADLSGIWTIMTDNTQDNAAALVDDPKQSASFERCGRLLGRTIVNQPDDQVNRYIGGEAVSFFSQATVYATAAGAIDCGAENAARLAQPGELAKAFGALFIDPLAVAITPVDFPPVGESSIAFDLTGDINAAGTTVSLTLLVVSFRSGNVTAVVGSAAAGAPSADEIQPLVNTVLERIRANQ